MSDDIESSSPDKTSFGARAKGGAFWLGLSQAVKIVSTLFSTIVVAHILQPTDYGVVAMLAPVTAFVLLVQDLGISQAIIQRRSVTDQMLDTAFILNVAVTAVLAVLLLICAPWIGRFYGDGRIASVIRASSLSVIAIGLGLQHIALLVRDFRFRSLGTIDIVSAFVTSMSTIMLALLWRSYWSLWFGAFLGILFQTMALWLVDRWRPRMRFSMRSAEELASFASGVVGTNLMNYFMRNADNVVIARWAGSVSVGLYDQCFKVIISPLQAFNVPIGRVMMPILARLQDEPGRYRQAFLNAVRAILIVLTPGLAVAVGLSGRIIPFLLGEKWAAAGPIFFWLSLSGFVQPIANATTWLFLSSGRTRSMLICGVASTVLTVGGFLIAAPWGAVGVAFALLVTTICRLPILFYWGSQGTSIRVMDLFLVMMRPTLLLLIVSLTLEQTLRGLPTVAAIPIGLIGAYLLQGLFCLLFSQDRQVLLSLVQPAVRKLRNKPE